MLLAPDCRFEKNLVEGIDGWLQLTNRCFRFRSQLPDRGYIIDVPDSNRAVRIDRHRVSELFQTIDESLLVAMNADMQCPAS